MTPETQLTNTTYDELAIGMSASLSKRLTMQDIQLFAVMSGDYNPAHLDGDYAKSSRFHEIIAHGMWGGALISTVLGTVLPGIGTIYVSQTLEFCRPVHIGDTLVVTVMVLEKHPKNRVTFDCSALNQAGEVVLIGQATVLAPSEKISREVVGRCRVSCSPSAPSSQSS